MQTTDKVHAFVLRSYPFGQAHQMSTLFTQELGKIKVSVYGIRKPKSQWATTIELLNEVSCVVQSSKSNIYQLKEATMLSFFQPLRETYRTIACLYYIAEYLDRVTQENDPHPNVFKLLQDHLNLATQYPNKILHFVRSLELKVLTELGFLPSLDSCSQCSQALIDNRGVIIADSIHISSDSGWISCHSCPPSSRSLNLSLGSYRYLRYLLKQPISLLQRLQIPLHVEKELNPCFEKLAISVIGKPLQSSKSLFLI